MSQERPSNADVIADALVRRLREAAADMETKVNRLYRGRNSYDLNAVAKRDLEKTVKRPGYMVETLRAVQPDSSGSRLQRVRFMRSIWRTRRILSLSSLRSGSHQPRASFSLSPAGSR